MNDLKVYAEDRESLEEIVVAQRFGADLSKTRQGVEREYVTRTRVVWWSRIHVRGKVEAQNTWGAGVMQYSLGTIDWPRSTMKELDRTTRRIMRQNQAHQYGTSIARLYLPRNEGGRGLVNLEHKWEVETPMAATYLHSNPEQQVKLAMQYMEQLADTNSIGLVVHALGIGDSYQLTNLPPALEDEDEHLTPIMTANIVRTRQKQSLKEESGENCTWHLCKGNEQARM